MKTLAFVGAIVLLTSLAVTGPAGARFQEPPVVDIQTGAAGMSPDGRTIGVTVLASCPERWTVVEATVTVSQPSGSGQASFPLTCIKSMRPFSITYP